MQTKRFTTSRLTGLMAAGAVGATMAFAGSADAKSLNEGLVDVANASDWMGEERGYILNDNDWSVFRDGALPGNPTKTSGNLSVGDIIEGSFDFDKIEGGNVDAQFATGSGGNGSLFGRFSIKVKDIVTDAQGTTVQFTSNHAAHGWGEGVMYQFFTDDQGTFQPTAAELSTDGGFGDGRFATADLWYETGIDDEATGTYELDIHESWIAAVGNPLDITAMLAAPSTQLIANLGTVEFDLLNPGTIADVTSGFGPLPLTAQDLTIRGSGSGTNTSYLNSDATFVLTATVVPVPAAAWAGMGLLGLMGAGRVFRRKFIEKV